MDLVVKVSKMSEACQLHRDSQKASEDRFLSQRLANLLTCMSDVEVVLIKLADRLHNLRTIHALSMETQLRIVRWVETWCSGWCQVAAYYCAVFSYLPRVLGSQSRYSSGVFSSGACEEILCHLPMLQHPFIVWVWPF